MNVFVCSTHAEVSATQLTSVPQVQVEGKLLMSIIIIGYTPIWRNSCYLDPKGEARKC